VAQPLDLGVVNLVFTLRLGMGKAAARHEIDMDGQPPCQASKSTACRTPILGILTCRSEASQPIGSSAPGNGPVRMSVETRLGLAE
jgi:hypothetical protein